MRTGQVKTFSRDKDYGFIIPDDKSSDVFFHRKAVKPPVSWVGIGQKVEYEAVWNASVGTPRATVVRVLNRALTPVSREAAQSVRTQGA